MTFFWLAGMVWGVVLYARRRRFRTTRHLSALDGRYREAGGRGTF